MIAETNPSGLRTWSQARDWVLRDYLRKWVVLGVLIGVVAGLGAIVFYEAIAQSTNLFLGDLAGLHPPLPRGEGETIVTSIDRRWAIPLVLVLGGLLSGILVFTLAPEAEGHGTDAAIEAFHERGGVIRPIIPPVKIIASAITIGSGGSAGREGPTAQIAAGFGSILGDIFRLTPQDRRIAVAVGVGAGIGAIFKAPLGGAFLAAEILYIRDFEVEALIPGFIASVIGYCIFATYAGWDPVFGNVTDLKFEQPESLIWYAAMGIAAGAVGIGYAKFFYGTRDFFKHRIRIPPHFKPAIGALAVGLIGVAFPEALSTGYGWLQFAIEGDKVQLAVGTMVALIALKIIATSLTIGSGGSGGVFAPGLFIGGMLGGSIWWGLHSANIGWIPDQPAPFVIVGMMALFGGVAKAPIAVMLMVAEMTGEFSMIVPAMLASTLAYLVTGNVTIYENQVESRAKSPAHRAEFTIPLVQQITVGDAMSRTVISARPDEPIGAAEERMQANGVRSLPVLEGGKLVGMFSGTDLLHARAAGQATVGEAMVAEIILAYPADNLHSALQRMARAGVSRLPVVERERPDRIIGVVSMRDIGAVLDLELSALAVGPRSPAEVLEEDPLRTVLVREAMRRRFETVTEELSIKRVANRLSVAAAHAALVVNEEGVLRGIVTLGDLAKAADDGAERPVSEIATKRVIVTRPDRSVSDALAQPGAEELRQIPVVEQRDGQQVPVGMLNRSDVVAAYLRSRDRQAQIAKRARSIEREARDGVQRLDILIRDWDPAAGRTLAELGLPANAVVTAVLREGKLLVPRGQLGIEAGDHLQLLVSADVRDAVIEALQQPKSGAQGQ